VPRDRNGTFEPKLVKKRQTHFTGFDDKILSMYARGMSQRDIQAHLEEMYGTDVGHDLTSHAGTGGFPFSMTDRSPVRDHRARLARYRGRAPSHSVTGARHVI
jgi:hypothetical protein